MITAPIVAIFVITFLAIHPALAAERFVNAGSDGTNLEGANDCLYRDLPCKTITRALQAARSGDTIIVRPGLYNKDLGENFPLEITTPISIVAKLDPTEPERQVVIQADTDPIIRITEQSSGSFLRGLTLKFEGEGTGTGIRMENVSRVRVEAMILSGLKTGISIHNSSGITLFNNTIQQRTESTDVGIDLLRSSANQILENQIVNGRTGITLRDESNGNFVSRNGISTPRSSGIAIFRSSKNRVEQNKIDGASLGIFVSESTGGTHILENDIQNARSIAIAFQNLRSQSADNILSTNVLTRNKTGIRLLGSYSHSRIFNNRITDTQGKGIILDVSRVRRAQILGTLLERNLIENSGDNGITVKLREGSEDNAILDNIVKGLQQNSGISLVGSHATIVGNQVERYAKGVEVLGDNNTLANNTVERNSSLGIFVSGSQNILRDNGVNVNRVGLQLTKSQNRLIGNTLSGNECEAIALEDGQGNTIQNNVLTANGKGTGCADGASVISGLLIGAIILKGESSENLIIGNAIEGNLNGIHIQGDSQNNAFQCNAVLNNDRSGILVISANNGAKGNRFTLNNITGNRQSGLYNFMRDATVDARQNWWGSSLGPSVGEEVTGDRVLGLADFTPWLRRAVDLASCP